MLPLECLAACLDRNTHCPGHWRLCNGAVFPVGKCLVQDGSPLETLPARERFPIRAPRHCEKQHWRISLPPAHLQSLPGNVVLPWERQEQLWKEGFGGIEELSADLMMFTQLHIPASHPQAVPAKPFTSQASFPHFPLLLKQNQGATIISQPPPPIPGEWWSISFLILWWTVHSWVEHTHAP